MTLYFAYGSNLNKAQMKLRCPGAVPLTSLTLKDWQLVFRGVADVVPAAGSRVHGAVWKLTPDCERALDAYEGIGSGLYRRVYVPIEPFEIDGEWHDDMLLYVMNSTGIFPPSRYYLHVIREGFRDFKLPQSSLDAAVEAAHDDKAPSHIERRRHQRKGRPELAPRPSDAAKARAQQPQPDHRIGVAPQLTRKQKHRAKQKRKLARKLETQNSTPQSQLQLDLSATRRAMVVYGD